MPRIQRHRAAAGQGRGQRDNLRRTKTDAAAGPSSGKQAPAENAVKSKAKAAPSPRKADPARATGLVDRPKGGKAGGAGQSAPEAARRAPRTRA